MNILIINGSPRKKGLISQMLSIMQEEAETQGDTVEMVYTNDLTVKPCAGCMACRAKEKCVLAEDDSQRVLKMMQQADAIIMGAPCYWGNIPGQMKLMFDRQVYGMMRAFSRTADERQEVYPYQHLHHALALEHSVQTVARSYPCYA